MTFEQAVTRISKKFLKRASKTIGDFNAEVLLTNEDCGGVFSIRVANGKVAVEPYDYADCDVRIICTYDNFVKFISDEEATYEMNCNSTKFADILAVVRKGVKSAKKEAEPENDNAGKKDEAEEKPAEAELKAEPAEVKAKKETAAKKTTEKKTTEKKTTGRGTSKTGKTAAAKKSASSTKAKTKAKTTKATKTNTTTKRAKKSVAAENVSEAAPEIVSDDK